MNLKPTNESMTYKYIRKPPFFTQIYISQHFLAISQLPKKAKNGERDPKTHIHFFPLHFSNLGRDSILTELPR